MDKDGLLFVTVPAALSIIAATAGLWTVAGALALVASFMVFFFRDPVRSVPEGENLIVSAADGRVTRIEERGNGVFVSVFLSPFDVHINRSPIKGTVTNVKMFTGKKRPATGSASSETNERNSLIIDGDGLSVECTQIVGILARRIVCRAKATDRLELGEKLGLIRFGSRTDLLMPKTVKVMVGKGDKVFGGETVIAVHDV